VVAASSAPGTVIHRMHAHKSRLEEIAMNIIRSFASPLVAVAVTLGASGLAHADPPTLTKALADVVEMGKSFTKLEQERGEAVAALKQAQAELDVVSKLSPKATDDVTKIQKRVDDANGSLKHLDEVIARKQAAFKESAAKVVQEHANAPQPGAGSNAGSNKAAANNGQPGPNSDLAAELEKLAAGRVTAEAELAKAKADLDAVNKQDPKLREKTEALKKQIEGAQRRIKHANDVLGPIPKTVTFKANTPEEVQQAQQLPQKVQSLLKPILEPYRLNDKVTVKPTFNPITKEGTITIQWKGNP
jgi:predicted  nucleic acid-binding Zn-ribbon protein